VDRTRVSGLAALREAIGERESFLLTVQRGNQRVIVPVR
jgi:hypothetical protein